VALDSRIGEEPKIRLFAEEIVTTFCVGQIVAAVGKVDADVFSVKLQLSMSIKNMKIKLGLASLLSAVAMMGAGSASAAVIVSPTSGVIDIGGPGFGSLLNTYDQSGLSTGFISGVTDFDGYLALNPTHTTTFDGFEWFSNEGTTSATVTYDLGSSLNIDRLALWNEESSGIGSLNLSYSNDNITFSSLGTFAPFDNPSANYPAEVFSFASTSARYVRFDMSGCPQPLPGSFASCAIGEVAFSVNANKVPEPSGILGTSVLAIGFIGRKVWKNRKKQAIVSKLID
jgi:hypothetical protein